MYICIKYKADTTDGVHDIDVDRKDGQTNNWRNKQLNINNIYVYAIGSMKLWIVKCIWT